LQALLSGAYKPTSGVVAAALGAVTLFIAMGSVFGELQAALNRIWKAEPPSISVPEMVRARAISFGLVMAVGLLSLVLLLLSTAITAADQYLDRFFTGAALLFEGLNFIVSLAIMTGMFATIYRVLPNRRIAWRDVLIGAAVTALLFSIGKSLIGIYLGSRFVTRVYGAAGGIVIILLWIYFEAQIFLFGAEFTRVYAERRGSGAPKIDGRGRAEFVRRLRGRSARKPER
jgi:membrane protein